MNFSIRKCLCQHHDSNHAQSIFDISSFSLIIHVMRPGWRGMRALYKTIFHGSSRMRATVVESGSFDFLSFCRQSGPFTDSIKTYGHDDITRRKKTPRNLEKNSFALPKNKKACEKTAWLQSRLKFVWFKKIILDRQNIVSCRGQGVQKRQRRQPMRTMYRHHRV